MDATDYLDLILNMAENTEAAENLDITAEEIKDMSDGIYYYIDNPNVNFNVVVTEVGDIGVLDEEMLEMIAVSMETQYGSMTGYNYEGYEVVKVNDYNSLRIDMSSDADVFGADLKMNIYMLFSGTKQFVVTYTAEASGYDAALADFEEVLNSISLE